MINIEDLESEIDNEFQNYVCDWSYSYSYRFCFGLFQRVLINDYFFNLFSDNKKMIEDIIQDIRKELTDISNDLSNYENEYDYLISQSEEFNQLIQYTLNKENDFNYMDWDEVFEESFSDFIDSCINTLKELHDACFEFIEDFRSYVIKKIFTY